MKTMKYLILSSVLLNCVIAEIKIGYVDSNEIMSNFEEVRQVQVDLEKEQRRLEGDLNNLISRLDSLKQDYQRQRLLMSESRRNEKENEITNMEKSIQKFQLDKFGPEGEIYKKQNQLLNEEQFRKAQDEYGGSFRADMGAEAIKELLKRVDIEELAVSLRVKMREESSVQKKLKYAKRLKVVDSFRRSNNFWRHDCHASRNTL